MQTAVVFRLGARQTRRLQHSSAKYALRGGAVYGVYSNLLQLCSRARELPFCPPLALPVVPVVPVLVSSAGLLRARMQLWTHVTPWTPAPVISAVPDPPAEPYRGFSNTSRGVDVQRAEADFAELNRELSRTSELSRRVTRSRSRPQAPPADVEKAPDSDTSGDETFDLEGTLRGNRDEAEREGIKSKRIGVVWDRLTVRGAGGIKNFVMTFPMAFVSFFNVFATVQHLLGIGQKRNEVDILRNLRGVAKPGEMVLVLGRPGSGCTTFLKTISNQRYGFTSVDGDVLYGPFATDVFEKRYRGEAVNCEEDENHHATLTVGQTLDFALETKIPGKRPAGLSRNEFKRKRSTCFSKCSTSSTPSTPLSGTRSCAASRAASGSVCPLWRP